MVLFPLAGSHPTRSLADLFLDYGDGYITAGPLSWRPGAVPAKAVVAELANRDVDLTDREAIDDAIRQLSAEQLPRRLTQD